MLDATGGKLTALFNNGAYGQPGAVEDLTPDVLRAQFEANVFGWHDLTAPRHPGDAGARRGADRVLLLGARPGGGALSRRLLRLEIRRRGACRRLRMELAATGIKIVLIEPGPIASRFLEHALEAYRRNIDLEASAHSEIYRTRIARLEEGGDQTFKLGPEAVALKLVHALESRNPKPRYYVTIPTYAAALLRRLLPTRALDAIAATN